MGNTEHTSQHPKTDAFRSRLRKITQASGTQDKVQRVMLALGYSMALTPTGNPGFTRPTMYKGVQVNVWITHEDLTMWPKSLLDPVWVGYYTPDHPVEMIVDIDYSRLMDYLLEHHPESFDQPSEYSEGSS